MKTVVQFAALIVSGIIVGRWCGKSEADMWWKSKDIFPQSAPNEFPKCEAFSREAFESIWCPYGCMSYCDKNGKLIVVMNTISAK